MRSRRPGQLGVVDSEGLGPTLEFMRNLWSLNHALEVTSKSMEARLGVTAQQRMLLRIVGKFPGTTPGRIAELLHVHRGTVSVALKRLEKRGIIKRSHDTADGRQVIVSLTKRGKALDVPASGTVESAVACLLKEASGRDISAVRRAFHELAEALQHGR
jgi:DNA-binding MarR family transcriptional regulator